MDQDESLSRRPEAEIIRLDVSTQQVYRCQQVADLHISEIHHGVLPLLGPRALARLYGCIAQAPRSGVWLALEEDRLAGFLAGCFDVKECYRSALMNGGWGLLSAILGLLAKPRNLPKITSLLTYPFRVNRNPSVMNSPQGLHPELLAIAVRPECRGQGIGKRLITAFEDSLSRWGFWGRYFVTTNINEAGSNAFYGALGFEPEVVLPHHDLRLQLYSKRVHSR